MSLTKGVKGPTGHRGRARAETQPLPTNLDHWQPWSSAAAEPEQEPTSCHISRALLPHPPQQQHLKINSCPTSEALAGLICKTHKGSPPSLILMALNFLRFLFFKIKLCIVRQHVSFSGSPVGKNLPIMQETQEMQGSILGSRRSPGWGNGNLLQHSCPENPMDRRPQWATVHGVAKSQIWLKWLSMQATLNSDNEFIVF